MRTVNTRGKKKRTKYIKNIPSYRFCIYIYNFKKVSVTFTKLQKIKRIKKVFPTDPIKSNSISFIFSYFTMI